MLLKFIQIIYIVCIATMPISFLLQGLHIITAVDAKNAMGWALSVLFSVMCIQLIIGFFFTFFFSIKENNEQDKGSNIKSLAVFCIIAGIVYIAICGR